MVLYVVEFRNRKTGPKILDVSIAGTFFLKKNTEDNMTGLAIIELLLLSCQNYCLNSTGSIFTTLGLFDY